MLALRLPPQVMPWKSLLAAAAVLLWLLVAGMLVVRELAAPTRPGIAMCAAIVLLPIVALAFLRLPVYLFALYAALMPFDNLLVSSSGATMGKYLGVALSGTILLALLASRRTAPPPRSLGILLLFFLYAGLTIFGAIDLATATSTYGLFASYAVFYALLSIYPFRERDANLVVWAMLAGAAAAALYGDNFFFHGQQIADNRLYIGWNDQQSIDPNDYATTLLAPIAIALAYCLRARAGLVKLGYLMLLAVFFSGVAISGSRGAATALAAIALYFLWRSRFKIQLAALLVPVTAAIWASPIGARLMTSDVATADGRTQLWKVGIAALRAYWITGAGPGNFPNAYDRYYLSVWHTVDQWSRPAHSVFLQSAVEYGIAGLVLVLVLWYAMFRELREAEHDAVFGDLAMALRASVLGLFVAGFSLDLLMYKYTWLTFALVAMVRSAFLRRQYGATDGLEPSSPQR